MPLVHRKLANTDLDIETIVVLNVNTPFHQEVLLHTLVYYLATLDFRNELPPSISVVSHETFVPDVLVLIRALWAFSSSHADENANFTPGPFIYRGFV
ncbi:hypothetical protein RRF57_010116 [Xylaria bambusicola]|uniref:Uncharacterized protein n=1 Tax=Xylaria bambusicola TaxID=326684 RepID=A0AAN7ZCJ7_9PEZI